MTTKELLGLDGRMEKNQAILQKALSQIKPLAKYSGEVPQWAIEKVLHNMCYKYQFWVREIAQDPWSNSEFDIWRATVVEDKAKGESADWNGTKIFGASIYEVLAKTAVFVYSKVKSGKAGVRN